MGVECPGKSVIRDHLHVECQNSDVAELVGNTTGLASTEHLRKLCWHRGVTASMTIEDWDYLDARRYGKLKTTRNIALNIGTKPPPTQWLRPQPPQPEVRETPAQEIQQNRQVQHMQSKKI